MGKSISQSLVNIRSNSSVIFYNIVTGRRHGTLSNFLRYQEEIESLVERHFVVDNRAARWVARSTSTHGEKSRVDSLAYDNECDGWIIHTSPKVICSSTSIGTSLLLEPKNNCIKKTSFNIPTDRQSSLLPLVRPLPYPLVAQCLQHRHRHGRQ